MSKSKNNGVATIDAPVTEAQPFLRINFEDLDAIETVESEPVKEAAPASRTSIPKSRSCRPSRPSTRHTALIR